MSWRICARSAMRSRRPSCPSVPAWSWPRASCPPPPKRSAATLTYLVAEGPQDSTVLVVGHGLPAGRRSAFVETAFAATAPFSDDPVRLLSWANAALIERAGISSGHAQRREHRVRFDNANVAPYPDKP